MQTKQCDDTLMGTEKRASASCSDRRLCRGVVAAGLAPTAAMMRSRSAPQRLIRRRIGGNAPYQ